MSNAPKVRFARFAGDWEQRKLGDTFDFLQNNTLSRADLDTETGFAKNVHYGDVLIRFGEYLDASSSALPYIPSRQIVDKFKGSLLQDGDVIMADTAEDEAVGKCTEIAGLQGFPTISGLHTIPLRPKEEFAPGYLGYYMNSVLYHDQLLPFMQGTKVTSVSKSAILNTDISYPADSDEQAEIGGFFIQLDNLITLHQCEYEKLVLLKSACLDKMFPKNGSKVPELRFAGFTGDWEQRKLSEMTTYRNGRGHEDKQSDSGRYELINLNSVSIDGGLKPSGRFIDESSETLFVDDLVMVLSDVGHGDLLGRVAIIPENNRFVLNQRVALLRPNNTVYPRFLLTCINAHQRYFKLNGAGSSQLNISKDVVEDFAPYVPKIDEQKLIAHYFDNINNLITLHQRKLEKLKQLKQSMLYSMFV